jgi:hypothetical protein
MALPVKDDAATGIQDLEARLAPMRRNLEELVHALEKHSERALETHADRQTRRRPVARRQRASLPLLAVATVATLGGVLLALRPSSAERRRRQQLRRRSWF